MMGMGFFRLITRLPGPSGFGSSSTAEQVISGINASYLTAIIIGGSSGIGAETARVLALREAHVIIAVRNMEAANDVKQLILQSIPFSAVKIDILKLDLSSLSIVFCFLLGIRYSNIKAYGQSKMANILHATEFSRRLKAMLDNWHPIVYWLFISFLRINKNKVQISQ
ncbi:hypothetical protein Cni_G15652 [Canna indica]|uniref:Uncharacterized protein n=1 Tax=Canna indica TaxID=4628 RepID=A0AAQ3KI96_9LILI|nr:hypothetical protein Cni_G15652 [Canna indica]